MVSSDPTIAANLYAFASRHGVVAILFDSCGPNSEDYGRREA